MYIVQSSKFVTVTFWNINIIILTEKPRIIYDDAWNSLAMNLGIGQLN